MADTKRKYSIWLSADQAERFEAVYKAALARSHGRTNYSEVFKELMGFPVKEGVAPLLNQGDRLYISGLGELPPEEKHAPGTTRILKASSAKDIGRGKVDD